MNNDSKSESEITFDVNSGICEDEQKEILAKINGIAEDRRRELAAKAETNGKKSRFRAEKSGSRFPLIVNFAAIAALATGILVLASFQGKTDTQVRTGQKVYNSAERALIDEIRKDTYFRLEAKENEISEIRSKLEGVDSELRELHSGNAELTGEQHVSEDRLEALQEEYRTALAALQNERAKILEEARAREAVLQAQLESRTREFAGTAEHDSAAMELAHSELERLRGEQAQAATVEAQMGAFFANLNNQINENLLDEAMLTIQSMRNFLNTPVFMSLRSIRARRDLYNQSIDAFETMVEETQKYQQALAAGVMPTDAGVEKNLADLRERNAQLEQTIEAFTSEGSGTAQRLADLQRSESTLKSTNTTLQGNVARLEASSREKDSRISTLESDLNTQTRNAETSQQRANNLQGEVTRLNQTVEARNNTITSVRGIVQGGGDIADMSFNQIRESLERIQQALGN